MKPNPQLYVVFIIPLLFGAWDMANGEPKGPYTRALNAACIGFGLVGMIWLTIRDMRAKKAAMKNERGKGALERYKSNMP